MILFDVILLGVVLQPVTGLFSFPPCTQFYQSQTILKKIRFQSRH
jgi:hypothetical protein